MAYEGSFQVTNAAGFMDTVLLPQYHDFVADIGSTRHALLTALTAVHLYEWVHPNQKFDIDHFKATYPGFVARAEFFEIARKLANGTKHFEGGQRAKTRRQGGFSSAFSDAFARALMIEKDDGTEVSAFELLKEIVVFWEERRAAGDF